MRLPASNKVFPGLFCLVSVRISAYPKRFPLHSLALARTESSQGTRKCCFHLKNNPNIGVMIKGKKNPDYIVKYPQFRKQVQSIRNSNDEGSKTFFSSQHSVQKTNPCSEFSSPCSCVWCFMQASPSYISHAFLSQIPASAILLCLALGITWHVGWGLAVLIDIYVFCSEWRGHRLENELTPLYQPYTFPSVMGIWGIM